MLLRGTGFYIWVILGIVWTVACLAECGRYPLEGVCKPVDCSTCHSFISDTGIVFLNTHPSYLGLDYGPGSEQKVPVLETVSNHSKLMFPEWMVQTLNYLHAVKYQANQGQLLSENFSCAWLILKPKCQTTNMSLQGNMESPRRIGQSNTSGIYVVDDHDPFFPPVSLDIYFAKSIIAVKYMIQQPVMAHNICLPSPGLRKLIHHDSSDTSRSGFFVVVNILTQAVLHPYNMASLNGSYPSKSLFIEDASFGLMVNRDLNFEQASGISISMFNLCIVTVLATVLIFLVFWLITSQIILSHSVDDSIKSDKRSIQVVRPKQKSSAVHLSQRNRKSGKSTKMAHFKSVQRDESSFSASLVSNKPVIIDSNAGKFEESSPVSSTVRTRKDKKKRPRKKNGVTAGTIAHMEVLNYNENSKTTSSLTSEEILFNDSTSLFIRDTIVTFPGLERSALNPPISAPSKLAISSLSRAPGPRSKKQKAVEAEERGDCEDRFRYDIWGDHFSRIGLMFRPDDSFARLSENLEGVSHSFFVSDPLQTLMRNSSPAPVTVTLSMEEI